MDNSALLNEFLLESFENLSSISEDLTLIEKDPQNKELLNKIYRTVHTMKGSASFLGFTNLQEITHSAENLLDEIREDKFAINSEIIDALLDTFDICNNILKVLEGGGDEATVLIKENKERLDKFLVELNGNSNEPIVEDATQQDEAIDERKEDSFEDETKASSEVDSSELSESGELASLVSFHKKSDPNSQASADDSDSKVDAVVDSEFEGMSAAALDSLRELIGEGKVDPSSIDELKAEKITNEAVKEIVEAEVKPEIIKEVVDEPEVEVKPVADSADDSKKSIADSFIRVNVKVLDKIMNIVGELVLNRNQIVQYSNLTSEHEFSRLSQQLNIITTELQSEVMSTRMQPIGNILTKFERLVRDFSRKTGKDIQLTLSGQETELDKTLIEAIKDPLVHIIRNACDHAIEPVDERESQGKNKTGTVLIKAYNESGQVTIEIVDDGRGLDKTKIIKKAHEKKLYPLDKLEKMADSQIYGLIFAPGFSTAEKVTNISGRGVGMDVVKTNIEKIGGTVSVNSEIGVGTTFKLRIPLTLAIVPALIVKSNKEAFAIPQLNLVELVRLETEEEKANLETIQGSKFLKLRGELTPVFWLNKELELEKIHQNNMDLQSVTEQHYGSENDSRGSKTEFLSDNSSDSAYNIVIMSAEDHCFGVIVDEILDTEEIVVKPLNSSLKRLALYGGATIMGDGKVALILDAFGFLNTVSSVENSSVDKNINDQASDNLFEDCGEFQENLLFKLFDDRVYAVPLSLVSRLEEFSVDNIEKTGAQPIMRYLNAPMPLINIEKTLQLDGISRLENYKEAGETAISCIVTSVQGKNFGIIVKEVLDISIDQVSIDDTAVDREGIIGTVFIDGKTISLIDLYTIIEAQNIGGFGKRHDFKPDNLNKKILVVDDSSMYRKIESEALKDLGFEIETANNGDEGFNKITNGNFDLVITDIEMPVLDGYGMALKVRNEMKNDILPIIGLSTRFSEQDIKKGKESGFNHHLEKFKKHEVLDLVINILNGKS